MEINLYHYLKPSTFGQFFTSSSSDDDFLTRVRMSAIDSMRLQKNLKSLILYRTSDSLLLSTLSVRTDFTDGNPAYSYVTAAFRSEHARTPGFISSSDGDILYYFPFFERSSPQEPAGCAMVQLRFPDEFFQISVEQLNPKGTFLILNNGQILSIEGYNILSSEVIETILRETPPLGKVFTYDNADISKYSFYCAPSAMAGMQYVYYEPVSSGIFSSRQFFKDNGLAPFLFACSTSVLFFLIAVFQLSWFEKHRAFLESAASQTALPVQRLSADAIFPSTQFSRYSGILIEYKSTGEQVVLERLQSTICSSCEQYLSGCQIAYRIIPQQLYICCYINYSEYNMRVLTDSLKQILYNTVENCHFNFYFTNALDSAGEMLDEVHYLQRSLHYTQVLGYGKRFSSSFIRSCDSSTAVLDTDITPHIIELLNSKNYDEVIQYLKRNQEKISFSSAPNSAEQFSYNAIYHFMESAFFAVKGYFLEKSYTHPLACQNMSSVLQTHPGFDRFCDYLIQSVTEYRESNEQSASVHEKNFMEAVYLYIDQNLSSVTLSSMAEHFHITSAHLSRMFKKNTDQNFSEYLSEKKLQKAIQLLEQDDKMNINEISKELGYSTPAYFLTKFKERYDITPSAYRKSYLTKSAQKK
ncbi:MAG: helix-turn-helix transcriptional regulator [Lachnospiraceae bacterium]|nr:helix-turn-helix transcriptional regulator [Lachnospiraceae bacterium]